MKETIERLWDEYFYEECAVIDTEEERVLIRKSAEMHKNVNELLTEEQGFAFEKYIETLYEIQGSSVKKAFLKGCEFAISFLLEAGNFLGK